MKRKLILAWLPLLCASTAFAGADIITIHRFGAMYHFRTDNPLAAIGGAAIHDNTGPIDDISPIEYRPSNGVLYGVKDNALYTIDTVTGFATQIGPFGQTVGVYDIDFDPVVDELRMTGNVNGVFSNIRVNPDTGAIIAIEQPFVRTNTGLAIQPWEIAHTSTYNTGFTRLYAMYGVPEGLPWDRWMLGEVGSAAGGQASFNAGLTTDIHLMNAHSYAVNSTYGFDITSDNRIGYTHFTVGVGIGSWGYIATVNLQTGEIRSLGRMVNMQNGASAMAVRPTPPCTADANTDGEVNAADLSVLLAKFGQSVAAGQDGDFNADGQVNSADLSILLAGFGLNCIPPA